MDSRRVIDVRKRLGGEELMNRRGFLGGLIGAASAMVLDPEKLLWVPGTKTIFIPKAIVAPPRIPIGVHLQSGRIIFWDEVFVDPTDSTAEQRDASGKLEAAYRFVRPIEGMTVPAFWVQTYGHCEVKVADYSPSLAS